MGKKWAEWEVQSSDLKSESESNHIWAAYSNKRYTTEERGEWGMYYQSYCIIMSIEMHLRLTSRRQPVS